MNEMEDLRQVAGYLVDIDEGHYARRVDKALRAWEADIARREALERLYSQSRLFFVAKRVLEGALDLGDLRIAVEEHEALHNGR